MNGLVSKIIVESELFELELAYHEEQKSWGILPHQLLAMKSSGIDPLAYRDLPALAQIYQGLEIDPEVEQACLSVVEDAKEAGYTPISIANDCYARLWGGKYRLGMPVVLFAKGNLLLLEDDAVRIGISVALGRASKSKVYLIDEYGYWLEDPCNGLGSEKSINSYLTALRSPKALSWIENDEPFLFSKTKEVNSTNTLNIISEVEELVSMITERLEWTKEKELSDQRSYLRKYLHFLREHLANSVKPHSVDVDNLDEEDDSLTLPLNILSGESDQVHEKEDLQSNFYWRLTTQDRLTKQEGAVYYPIRLLGKLFADSSSEYKRLFESKIHEQIDAIEIVVSESGKTIPVRDIDRLAISKGGAVYVYSRGEKLQVYTADASGTKYYPMEVKALSQIHIDHKTPISSILVKLAQEQHLPLLKELTEELRRIEREHQLRYSEQITANVLTNQFLKEEGKTHSFAQHLPELLSEMERVQRGTELQLMSSHENARKKA